MLSSIRSASRLFVERRRSSSFQHVPAAGLNSFSAASYAAKKTTAAFVMGRDWMRHQVLRNVVVFPRTANVKTAGEKALVTLSYDGSKEGFEGAIRAVDKMLELRALDIQEATGDVLRSLARAHEEFYLGTVDCVIIQRIGQHVLHLTNTKGESGRALFIELNEVRQGTMTIFETVKAKLFEGTSVVIIVTVVAGGLYLMRESNKEVLERITIAMDTIAKASKDSKESGK